MVNMKLKMGMRKISKRRVLVPAIVILVSTILLTPWVGHPAFAAKNVSLKEGTYQLNACESYSSGSGSISYTNCMDNLIIKIQQISAKYFKLKIDATQVNVCESTSVDGGTSTTTCSNNLTIELYDITATKVKVTIKGDQVSLCDSSSDGTSSTSSTTCTNGITITASQLTTSKFKLKTDFGQLNVCDSISVTGTSTANTECSNDFVLSVGSTTNFAPTAIAGSDQIVEEEAPVTLDASSSKDADKGPLSMTYYWTVVDSAGYDVTLSSPTSSVTSFTAPALGDGQSATLTFQVAVNDGQAVGTDTVSVTVLDVDQQAPTITTSDINVSTDPGQPYATVSSYSSAVSVSDNSGSATVSCSPEEGSQFPIGTTAVNCTATDSAGNSASASFNVHVADLENPSISQGDVTQNTDPEQAYATVSFTPSASDNSGSAVVGCTSPSGSTFSIGATNVSCTATDPSGNTASVEFTVTVNDVEAPTITASDINVSTDPGQSTATVNSYSITTSDNSGGPVVVECSPAEGYAFPVGTMVVSCTATDTAGNTQTTTFAVNVSDGSLGG